MTLDWALTLNIFWWYLPLAVAMCSSWIFFDTISCYAAPLVVLTIQCLEYSLTPRASPVKVQTGLKHMALLESTPFDCTYYLLEN